MLFFEAGFQFLEINGNTRMRVARRGAEILPRKSLRSTRLVLLRKSAVELSMRSDPKPKPFVSVAQCDRADVSGHADGLRAWIETQSLEA